MPPDLVLEVSLRELTATFQVPKDWVLLARTTVLLMGLCTHLNPTMNPVHTIRPYVEEAVLGPEKDWKALLGTVVKDMALSAVALPEELHRFLGKANRGEIEVKVHGMKARTNLLYALGHQFLYGLFALGTGILAYVAHMRGDLTLALYLAAAGGFFSFCLVISFLRARKWL